MAGRGLGTLTLDLIAKIGGFIGPLDKAERKLKTSTQSMNKSAIAFGTAIGNFLTDAITKFASSIPAVIDRMDEISKAAKTVGMSTEGFSRLSFAADLANVSQEELTSGLGRLVKAQAAAIDQGSKQAKIFKALGIATRETDGSLRKTRDVMLDFADIFQAMKGSPEALAAGLALFGRGFQTFVPLIADGAEGIRKAEREADELGITLSGPAGLAAEEFNDNLERLKTATAALFQEIAVGLLPELNKLTAQMVSFAKEGREGGGVAGFIAGELAGISKAARGTVIEIDFLKKAWNEQGWFGEGILSVLDRANTEMKRLDAAQDSLFSDSQGRGPNSRRGSARAGAAQGRLDLGAEEAQKRLREAMGGTEKAARKQKTEAEKLAEAYERMNAQMAETIALFNKTGEEAKVRYEIEHGELRKLGEAEQNILILKAQRIDQLAAEKKARQESIKLEEEERKEAQKHAKEIRELLDDIAFETSLTKLSNDEKERAIALRRSLAGATAEEAAQITAAVDEMLAAQKHSSELAGAMDDFRASFEDTVTDVLTGSKSIGDAFKSLADTIVAQIARIIAQQLTANLFGGAGSTGGWLGSLFGMFLGGSSSSSGSVSRGGMGFFAEGTNFAPGGPAVVGEHGPEIVNLPRGATVTPNNKLGGNSVTVQIIGGTNPRETAQQVANEVRRVLAFSGRSD